MELTVENLTKSFEAPKGVFFPSKMKILALNRVSFRLEEGKSLGIVGESGSGKTTLAKILAGFYRADSGQAAFGGHDLLSIDRKSRSKLVQMVFQDPFSSLNPKLLLGTQIFEALRIMGEADVHGKACELMAAVGLSEKDFKRYPHQLSGGQRQRFAIARALAADPKLLLADEPVSSLDIAVQAQIINLLNKLRREKKFTQVVIAHDLAVVANLCDHVIVMKDGEIVETAPVRRLLETPKSPYTQKLLAAIPTV